MEVYVVRFIQNCENRYTKTLIPLKGKPEEYPHLKESSKVVGFRREIPRYLRELQEADIVSEPLGQR
jgi:hypothetical protein